MRSKKTAPVQRRFFARQVAAEEGGAAFTGMG